MIRVVANSMHVANSQDAENLIPVTVKALTILQLFERF